tara:strand:+ start:577 stop:774 length:198 start_codon:yes stop_codon:yes gene_type:complete
MACENRNCGNCDCGPEDEATTKPTLKEFPIAQKRDVVYVERKKAAETGFWGFFWGMLFGSFFLGC